MRGALALALALTVPANVPERTAIILTAFVVVAFSILVQGLTMPWLLKHFDLRKGDASSPPALKLPLGSLLSTTSAQIFMGGTAKRHRQRLCHAVPASPWDYAHRRLSLSVNAALLVRSFLASRQD